MDVHPTKNVSIGIDPLPCLDGCGGGDPKESLSGLGVPLAHRGLWPGDEAQEATEIFIEQQIVGTCCGKPRGRLGDGIGPFAWRGLGEEICRFKLIKKGY